MEAASAHVPVVAIASQIPRDLIGKGRGYLHELPDQLASFAAGGQVGRPLRVRGGAARAARRGLAPRADAAERAGLRRDPRRPAHRRDRRAGRRARRRSRGASAAAGRRSSTRRRACSRQPSARCSGPAAACCARARGTSSRRLPSALGAPVATTFMGKGAFPEDHPLAVGSGCDEAAFAESLEDADVAALRRHRARGRDDPPVRAALRRAARPDRRGAGADRGDLPGARPRRRRRGGARRARRARPAAGPTAREARAAAVRDAASRAVTRARRRARAPAARRPSARRFRATPSTPGT